LICERIKALISQDHINSANIWWQDLLEVGCPIEESQQHRKKAFGGGANHGLITVVSDGAQIVVHFNLATVGHLPGAPFHHDTVNIT
jgi:hypothetical protein